MKLSANLAWGLMATVTTVHVAAQEIDCEIDCEPKIGCAGSQVDIVFSLDESGSMYWLDPNYVENVAIDDSRFTTGKSFISRLYGDLKVKFPLASFGLGVWSTTTCTGHTATLDGVETSYECVDTMPTSITDYEMYTLGKRTVFDVRGPNYNPGQTTFQAALDPLFGMGRSTYVNHAFDECARQMIPCRLDSSGVCVKRVCIVVSDGGATNRDNQQTMNTYNAAANNLKNDGVTVIFVGVGGAFSNENGKPFLDGSSWASPAPDGNGKSVFGAGDFFSSNTVVKEQAFSELTASIVSTVTCFSLELLPPYTCKTPGQTVVLTGDNLASNGMQCKFFRGTSIDSVSKIVPAQSSSTTSVTCPVPNLDSEFFATTYLVEVSKSDNVWTTNRNRIRIAESDCSPPTDEPFFDVTTEAKPTVPGKDDSKTNFVGGGGGEEDQASDMSPSAHSWPQVAILMTGAAVLLLAA
jgi:hypothetical protein